MDLGKTFNQRIAYSTDGGKSIAKLEGSVVKHISEENRDPKVYWHEESKAYYMVLYLKANDFMILRSRDLKSWKKTQVLTLDQASECLIYGRCPWKAAAAGGCSGPRTVFISWVI